MTMVTRSVEKKEEVNEFDYKVEKHDCVAFFSIAKKERKFHCIENAQHEFLFFSLISVKLGFYGISGRTVFSFNHQKDIDRLFFFLFRMARFTTEN